MPVYTKDEDGKKTLDVDQSLTKLKQWLQDNVSVGDAARREALIDRDYYDGKQWTEAERQELQRRGQPCLVFNQIQGKVDLLIGLGLQQSSDPVAVARTPNHVEDAQTVTDVLRYVEDVNRFDLIRSKARKQMLVEGIAGAKVEPLKRRRQGKVEYDIKIKPIAYDRIVYDPYSREDDFSDARFIGEVVWMNMDEAKARFPDKEEIVEASMSTTHTEGNIFRDTQVAEMWADRHQNRVKVVEMWYYHGDDVYYAIFSNAGFLVEPTRSPYKNTYGEDIMPYVMTSAHTDNDGNRYGYVRQLRDPQDEINKRRSKFMHMVNTRQIRISPSSSADIQQIRREIVKGDGVLVAEPDDLEIISTGDISAAQFQLLAEAKAQIDNIGGNPVGGAGTISSQTSGRSLAIRQQAGLLELGAIFQNLRNWEQTVLQTAWHMVQQYWKREKIIRVTDEDGSARFVELNKPLTYRDVVKLRTGEDLPPDHPRGDVVVGTVNEPAELDVDVIIRQGPDSATAQDEQFQQLVALAQSGFPVPPELLIAASSVRAKDELLQALQPSEDQQAQQQQQLQQQQVAFDLAARNQQADIAAKESKAAKNLADAQKASIEAVRKQQGQD